MLHAEPLSCPLYSPLTPPRQPNAKANLPGPLQRLNAARNRNAAPVKLSDLLGLGERESRQPPNLGSHGQRTGHVIEYPPQPRNRVVGELRVVLGVVRIPSWDLEPTALDFQRLVGRPAPAEQHRLLQAGRPAFPALALDDEAEIPERHCERPDVRAA